MVYIGLAITYSGTRGRVPSGGAAAAGHHPSMPVRGPTRLCSTSREPAADSNCMAGQQRPALTLVPPSPRPPPPSPRAAAPGAPACCLAHEGPPPARQGGQGAALSSSVGTTRRRRPDCTAATRTPGVEVCGRGSRLLELSHVSAACAHRISTTGHTSSAEPDPARPRVGNNQRVPHQPLRVWRSTRQHEHRRRARRYVL